MTALTLQPGASVYFRQRRWNYVIVTEFPLYQSPFRASIQNDTYQLKPLRTMLAPPWVNVFIADEVGLSNKIRE